MKVELHLHTSRYSGCSQNTPHDLMTRAIETGYDAVFITDHNAVWAEWEIELLQAEFPQIRIFPGVELSLGGGLQHLLVLGTTDRLLPDLADKPAEVLAMARDRGHLTILVHPFRFKGGDEILRKNLLPDAIEHCSPNVNPDQAELARKAGDRLSLPLINSGDTHALSFLDRFWIETHRPVVHADDIREIILAGEYTNRAKQCKAFPHVRLNTLNRPGFPENTNL